MKQIVFISLLIFLFFACTKNNDTVVKEIKLDGFHSIELNSPFDVLLQEDTHFFIELKGNADFIKKVAYTISDSVLIIENEAKNKWLHPRTNHVEIVVHAPPLKLVTANETCFIKTVNPITSENFGLILKSKSNEANLNLDCHNFYYWNNFPTGGKVKLSGQSEELAIWNCAIMTVDAIELNVGKAYIENSSKGNCTLNVSEQIECKITGNGNVELYGNPSVINLLEESGDGKLVIH